MSNYQMVYGCDLVNTSEDGGVHLYYDKKSRMVLDDKEEYVGTLETTFPKWIIDLIKLRQTDYLEVQYHDSFLRITIFP